MLSRHQRPWLLGAALTALALLPAQESCWAQVSGALPEEAVAGSLQKADAAGRKTANPLPPFPPSPPFPGQVINGSASKASAERHRRIPPILVAFVLLFFITWVRAFLERRRLRASFRQSCEYPSQ